MREATLLIQIRSNVQKYMHARLYSAQQLGMIHTAGQGAVKGTATGTLQLTIKAKEGIEHPVRVLAMVVPSLRRHLV